MKVEGFMSSSVNLMIEKIITFKRREERGVSLIVL